MISICIISRKISKPKTLLYSKRLRAYVQQRWSSKSVVPLPLGAAYVPKDVEARKWEARSSVPQPKLKRGTFRMILPPPNVTGNLHLGHALMAVVQDVICRHRRHMGYEVEWIPGMDHAGIATQVIVEKKIMTERGLSRHDLGRVGLLREVWKWKDAKGETIAEDLQKLGCTLNWEREYFTMDQRQENAVNFAFVKLFDDGLITRQKALLNWSCYMGSAISDMEVDTLALNGYTQLAVPGYSKNIIFGRLYDVSFRVCDTKEEIKVSTTRPETLLGDVAVAVHPDDKRYMQYRGRTEVKLEHPFRKEPIPLIFDLSVDKEFGTGAVKITPAHDKNDFNIAQKHLLEPVLVFDDQGKVREEFVDFAGLPRFTARERILEQLAEMQMLHAVRDHKMSLPICSRSKDIVEYMLHSQWFMHCQPLADAAMAEVRSGRLLIQPPNFETEWYRWLGNCNDWCLSRQLWWGHQIPAYFAEDGIGASTWVAALTEAEAVKKAELKLGSKVLKIQRDTDVLDTWFSAGLLPLSVFNWPNSYQKNIKLDLMETGHDILFFWVARMAMLGLKFTGEVPFKKVLLNGLICDAHGRKMSKSLGNVVTPQQVIRGSSTESMQEAIKASLDSGILSKEEYEKSLEGLQKMFPDGIKECGTDALRFTLCSHNISNHFINFDIDECYTNKLFLNKIWQATRFVLGASQRLKFPLSEIEHLPSAQLSIWDLWILSRLSGTLKVVAESFENYNFHIATAALKQFFYSSLCDVYLEIIKPDINAENCRGYIHCGTLAVALNWTLQAMSPFTPYITAALLQHLPQNPQLNLSKYTNPTLENEISHILEIVQCIRQVKSTYKINKKHEPKVFLLAENYNALGTLRTHLDGITTLSRFNHVTVLLESKMDMALKNKTDIISTAGHLCSIVIQTNESYKSDKPPIEDIKELNNKKLEKLQSQLEIYRTQLKTEGFRKLAPKGVKQKHLEKIQRLEVEISNIKSMASC